MVLIFRVKWYNIWAVPHAKMCLWAYVDSESPGQPARVRSLIRVCAFC